MISRVLAAELTDVAMAETYRELIDHISARRRELGLSCLELDDLAGLPQGYSSKLECYPARHNRSLGIVSLPAILTALGLRMAVVKVEPPEGLF